MEADEEAATEAEPKAEPEPAAAAVRLAAAAPRNADSALANRVHIRSRLTASLAYVLARRYCPLCICIGREERRCCH